MYSRKLPVITLICFILYQYNNKSVQSFRFKFVQNNNKYCVNRYQTSSINDFVGSTVKSFENKKIEVSKRIENNINEIISIPNKVQSNVQIFTNEVKDAVDAIVSFPSDVVNRMEIIRSEVSKSISDIQLKVVTTKDAIVKIPSDITMTIEAAKASTISSYENAINSIKTTKANTISNYEKVTSTFNQIKEKIQFLITLSQELYETKDFSIVIKKLKAALTSNNNNDKIKAKSNNKVVSPKEKSFDIIESFDNTKEFVYSSIDNTVSLYQFLNRFTKNTIETIQELPQNLEESQRKLSATQKQLQSQRIRLSEDITSMSTSIVKTVNYVWRFISLQIAREQYNDILKPVLDEFQSTTPVSFKSIRALLKRINTKQQPDYASTTTSSTITNAASTSSKAMVSKKKETAVSIVMDVIGTTKDVIGTVSSAVKDLSGGTVRLQQQYKDNLVAQGLRGERKTPQIITVKVYNNSINTSTSSSSTISIVENAVEEVKEVGSEVKYVSDIIEVTTNTNTGDIPTVQSTWQDTVSGISNASSSSSSIVSKAATNSDTNTVISTSATVEVDKEVENMNPSTAASTTITASTTIAEAFAGFPIVISDYSNNSVDNNNIVESEA